MKRHLCRTHVKDLYMSNKILTAYNKLCSRYSIEVNCISKSIASLVLVSENDSEIFILYAGDVYVRFKTPITLFVLDILLLLVFNIYGSEIILSNVSILKYWFDISY